jgi:hypothetical protein
MRRRGTDVRSVVLDRRLWVLLLLIGGYFATSKYYGLDNSNTVLSTNAPDGSYASPGVVAGGAQVADTSSLLYQDDRIYCMVPSMYNPQKLEAWGAILRSWGPSCDVIKFMVDPVADPSISGGGDGGGAGGSPQANVVIPLTFSIPESSKVAEIVVLPMVSGSASLSLCLSVCLVYLFVCLSLSVPVCLSVCL